MNFMNSTTYPDEISLVTRAIQGELDAFNQLVLNYQDLAYGLARSLLDDPFHAEDVTQESFIKAFQKIGQFRGGSFRSWLLKIVTHTAYDHLRRYKHQVNIPLYLEDEQGEEMESPPWLADPGLSIEAILEQGELNGYIQQLLEELPEAYRSVISLIDLYELDYKEAAETLNVPVGTIKSRLARARLQMKGKMLSSQVIEVQ